MKFEIVKEDENNFTLEVSKVDLDNKEHANFIFRLRGKLKEIYGRSSLSIRIDENIENGTFGILVPNGFKVNYRTIVNLIEAVYHSLIDQ